MSHAAFKSPRSPWMDRHPECQHNLHNSTILICVLLPSIEPNLDRRVTNLLQMIDELARLSSDMAQSSKKPPTPTTQRRLSKTNSVDRKEPSPAHDAGDMGGVLNRLTAATDEIRFLQKSFNEDRERDRMRRNNSMRRAVSIENGVNDGDRPPVSRSSRPVAPNGNLSRKCVSIDQSLMGQTRGKIWRNAGESNSSIQSIDSEFEFGGGAGGAGGGGNHVRDSSLDSRLSGGSTQSDLPRHTRKKKRGIMGTLKQLARSSSKANDTDGSVRSNANDCGPIYWITVNGHYVGRYQRLFSFF